MSRRQQQRQADQAELQAFEQQQQQAQAAVAAAPVAPAPQQTPGLGTDTISQLERLQALRDSHVLSDEEFETQKARILQTG